MAFSEKILREVYYFLKPLISRRLQLSLRRRVVLRKRALHTDVWPIDERAKQIPKGWVGWPEGKRFALLLTHDVETERGLENCITVANLDQKLGFRSSFNFVAKGYNVSDELKHYLVENGFEVGVHGLYHDGNLFSSERKFRDQASQINRYLKEWEAVGFRAPCMYHNLKWICDLNIDYDSSTFDTDPFEPQPESAGTIFPFWVNNHQATDVLHPLHKDPSPSNLQPPTSLSKGFVELPYTLAQDFTLFVLMKERNIDIWKRKLDWIVEKRGMALSITHPDYMDGKGAFGTEEYPMEFYKEFLDYVRTKYEGQYWHPLPKEMARFWREEMVKKRRGSQ